MVGSPLLIQWGELCFGVYSSGNSRTFCPDFHSIFIKSKKKIDSLETHSNCNDHAVCFCYWHPESSVYCKNL
jgi:hypothetical protein